LREGALKPEEVLEFIHTTPERYESVRAAMRYRGDGPTIKTVRERFARSDAYVRTFGRRPEPSEQARHPEPDGPFGWRCRVWRIDDHRWRQELDLPGGGLEIQVSTGRMRTRAAPEGPPGTSEEWEHRIGGGSFSNDPRWLIWLTADFAEEDER
jgi:hypothetical protein